MSRSYLTGINLNQNPLLNASIQNLATAPSTPAPVAGQIYYETTANFTLVYNGSAWIDARARANHSGTQLASTISNLASTVQAYSLSAFAAPTANLPMGGYTLTGLNTAPSASGQAAEYSWVLGRPLSAFAAPTANIPMGGYTLTGLNTSPSAAGQAAEYSWVIGQIQSAAAGIASKPPVQCVATGNLTLSGLQTIDGYTTLANDRVLCVGQTTATQNGVYAASSGAWTRVTDDGAAPGEIQPGSMWLVLLGTANAGTQWRVSTTGTITIGTTSITIVQFGAASLYSAGNGISLSGTQFSVNPVSGGGIVVSGSGAAVDTTVVARKYTTTLGDGSSLSYTVTHNLGTQNVVMMVRLSGTPYSSVEADMAATSSNTATIAFATAPAAGAYTVTVIG